MRPRPDHAGNLILATPSRKHERPRSRGGKERGRMGARSGCDDMRDESRAGGAALEIVSSLPEQRARLKSCHTSHVRLAELATTTSRSRQKVAARAEQASNQAQSFVDYSTSTVQVHCPRMARVEMSAVRPALALALAMQRVVAIFGSVLQDSQDRKIPRITKSPRLDTYTRLEGVDTVCTSAGERGAGPWRQWC